jgi:hypothetical protein
MFAWLAGRVLRAPAYAGGTPTASDLIMLAPRPASRLPLPFPHVVDLVVGSVLEVVVQSVEGLRDQVRRLSLR